MLSSWSMPTGRSDHPSPPPVLPSCSTGSHMCSSQLCVDYQDLNNLTIKNGYSLPWNEALAPGQNVNSDIRQLTSRADYAWLKPQS